MTDTPPAYTPLTADEIAASVESAAAMMRDAICAAHYSANNGVVSVADCYNFADVALATTDYANVLTGYANAANVAQALADGDTPDATTLGGFISSKAGQSTVTKALLP